MPAIADGISFRVLRVKRQVLNLRNCCIWLADLFESVVLHSYSADVQMRGALPSLPLLNHAFVLISTQGQFRLSKLALSQII